MSAATQKAFELAEPVRDDDHALGSPDARITIVEYGDFECPYCKQAAPAVKMVLAHFAAQLRFVFRHFPVEGNHPHAIEAAEATEFAAAQGRFWEMHDLLFENQLRLKRDDLRRYVDSLGLDPSLFETQMNEHTYLPVVRKHMEIGQKSGVRSTPAFFINNRIHDVSFGLHALVDAVDKVLKGN
jgi:protein-disulfide isomerase